MQKYKCAVCGYVYDESMGIPDKGISPGAKWESIPDSFACPVCSAPKSAFKAHEETSAAPTQLPVDSTDGFAGYLNELSPGEISAICSSLAKGCEKQRLGAEMDAFSKLSEYFKSKAGVEQGKTLSDAADLLADDLARGFAGANAVAQANADRGALRSLVWSEKVSIMMKALMEHFAKEGDSMLENTKIWVCDACGFLYVGDAPPEICPVCKVPNFRITEIERV